METSGLNSSYMPIRRLQPAYAPCGILATKSRQRASAEGKAVKGNSGCCMTVIVMAGLHPVIIRTNQVNRHTRSSQWHMMTSTSNWQHDTLSESALCFLQTK